MRWEPALAQELNGLGSRKPKANRQVGFDARGALSDPRVSSWKNQLPYLIEIVISLFLRWLRRVASQKEASCPFTRMRDRRPFYLGAMYVLPESERGPPVAQAG